MRLSLLEKFAGCIREIVTTPEFPWNNEDLLNWMSLISQCSDLNVKGYHKLCECTSI